MVSYCRPTGKIIIQFAMVTHPSHQANNRYRNHVQSFRRNIGSGDVAVTIQSFIALLHVTVVRMVTYIALNSQRFQTIFMLILIYTSCKVILV